MGSNSDYSIGAGTSVDFAFIANSLRGIPTGGMRDGDLAFVNDPAGGAPALGANRIFAFISWSKSPIAPGDVYYADISNGNSLNPGRWHRVNTLFSTLPTP